MYHKNSINFNLSINLEKILIEFKSKRAIQFNNKNFIKYSDLKKLIDNICSYLLKFEFNNNNLILIEGYKSFETYALILSCLNVGLPYALIDPNIPKKRLNKIINKHKPIFFYFNKIELKKKNITYLKKNFSKKKYKKIDNFKQKLIKSSDTAYIMFTSGSTGEPKAAIMSHNNLINFISWSINTYNFSKNEKILNLNAIYFDNSVFDIYSSFFTGSCLIPVTTNEVNNHKILKEIIIKNKCTSWFSVPSLILYLNKFKFFEDTKTFNSLKRIIFGGEGMPLSKLNSIYEIHKKKLKFYNVYGPTECTCICSSYQINDGDFKLKSKLPPIGNLNQNFNYILLNKANKKCKANESGEIHLSGPCVGKGYLNNIEETKSKFKIIDNEYYYKTGDLMKYNPKLDKLFFVGRIDNQIKHMGYRIELDEIELALTSLNYVNEAIVVYKNKNNFSRLICAISFLKQNFDEKTIIKSLKKIIPSYMIPNKFLFFKDLPKNPNGKIDRKKIQNYIQL